MRTWILITLCLLAAACAGTDSESSAPTVTQTSPTSPTTDSSPRVDITSTTIAACARVDDCTLREAGDAAGVLIGTAARMDLIDDIAEYEDVLSEEFSSITPENDLKWQGIHPGPDEWDFEPVDRMVEYAQSHDILVKGHNLIWEQELIDSTPDWVLEITDPQELEEVVRDHINTVMHRYDGRIDRWDVVNEPLETLGNTVYRNHFYDVLGPDYIEQVFRIAREADPDAVLFLNEVSTEFLPEKRAALIDLVTGLVETETPIDGVGLQAHLLAGTPKAGVFEEQIRIFRELGLDVAITELDVPATDGDLEAQADVYRQIARECVDAGCAEITVWGLSDGHTWLDDFLGEITRPLLFDEEYRAKPARDAVRDVFGLTGGLAD